MRFLLSLLLAAIAVQMGCDSPTSNPSDPIVRVEEDNEAMAEAYVKAKQTLPKFVARWKADPNAGSYSVKIGVKTSEDGLEHIWFDPVEITETEFVGICANEPAKVPDLKFGDKRSFPIQDVSDWMILSEQTCYGGYTIRVLAEMEPENAPPFQFKDL